MYIPNLPTDNLYKFIALSGLVIIIFSIYFSSTELIKLGDYSDELLLSSKEALIIAEWNSDKSDELTKLFDNSIALQNEIFVPDNEKITITYSNEEIKQLLKERDNALLETMLSSERVNHYNNVLSQNLTRIYFILFISLGLFIVGMILTINGFLFWFTRVQHPQDLKISASIQNKEASE